MSEKEYGKLVRDFGEQKTNKLIAKMNCYLAEDEKRQKKYKTRNHYMTLRNWERRDSENQTQQAQQPMPITDYLAGVSWEGM